MGRPNVGKSSLLNVLIGHKIAIVSNKPQTTRTKITGILTEGDTQLVFIDTPGLHKPKTALGQYMVRKISDSVSGVDGAILMVEAHEPGAEELDLINRFKTLKIPAVLVINKIDTLKHKSELAEVISRYSVLFAFKTVVPASVKNGEGVDIILNAIKEFCVAGPHFFDDDDVTDQPEKVIVSEIIREKILRLTDKEIPHGIAVAIEKMSERTGQSGAVTDIEAIIYCEKESHKGILIGKNGEMLKKIGSRARQDLEVFFDIKINLQLWIKVKEDWRNRQGLLYSLGFDDRE